MDGGSGVVRSRVGRSRRARGPHGTLGVEYFVYPGRDVVWGHTSGSRGWAFVNWSLVDELERLSRKNGYLLLFSSYKCFGSRSYGVRHTRAPSSGVSCVSGLDPSGVRHTRAPFLRCVLVMDNVIKIMYDPSNLLYSAHLWSVYLSYFTMVHHRTTMKVIIIKLFRLIVESGTT